MISYFMSTICEPLLYLIVGSAMSHSLWDCLHTHFFFQTSLANEAIFRFQLLDLSKGFKTAVVYIQEAKSLANQFAEIGEPIYDEYLVMCTIRDSALITRCSLLIQGFFSAHKMVQAG